MIEMNKYLIQEENTKSDGMGGIISTGYKKFDIVNGLLDLSNGSDQNNIQNAVIENSTHILVILDYVEGITDDMRIVDEDGRVYEITYSDDPAAQGNHNELYLTFNQGETYDWSPDDG